jgi:hypothetical protein
MWRGILSIIALLLICSSSLVMAGIWVIPNMGFYQFVPILQPLHQLACSQGETLEYEFVSDMDGVLQATYQCVNRDGIERDITEQLQQPATYALGVFCVGLLLMSVPFYIAIRRSGSNQDGAEMQALFTKSVQQMQDVATQDTPTTVQSNNKQQQLDQVDKLLQNGIITQEAYNIARQRILDSFK